MSSNKDQTHAGAATSSPWNTSPFSFAPNTNTLDPVAMPSKEAQESREKAAEVMALLKEGKTAEAEQLMGKDKSSGKLIPLGFWKKLVKGKGKDEKKEGQWYDVPWLA